MEECFLTANVDDDVVHSDDMEEPVQRTLCHLSTDVGFPASTSSHIGWNPSGDFPVKQN